MTGDADAWRALDRAALDAAYDNLGSVPDSAAVIEGWRARSAATRAARPTGAALRYGPGPREEIDLFPGAGGGGRGVFAFVHGGYWIRNDRSMFSFIADGLNAAGVDVAVIGYPLAPAARVAAIAACVRAALDRIAAEAPGAPLAVGGWSAGAHLAAMALDHPAVSAGVLVSGLYDLAPIAACGINATIGLDAAEAAAMSPILLPPPARPVAVWVGGAELPELRRQSRAYAAHAGRGGAAVAFGAPEGRNHFTILDDLASADGPICASVLAAPGLSAR